MISICVIAFGLSLFFVAASSRIDAYINAIILQGILLTVIMLENHLHHLTIVNFIFIILETVIFKIIIIPYFLMKIIRDNKISRETEPYIPQFFSILIVSVIFVFGFSLAYWSIENTDNIKPFSFGIAISTIISALFIIVSRKKLITHMIAYVIVENGIFLLSLSTAREFPIIVNLGILLDAFLLVLISGLFISKVKTRFEDEQIDNLRILKEDD